MANKTHGVFVIIIGIITAIFGFIQFFPANLGYTFAWLGVAVVEAMFGYHIIPDDADKKVSEGMISPKS